VPASESIPTVRRLVVVLGDQLNADSAAFDDFDPRRDAVWMAENQREAADLPCHQQRLVLFFSAMRHYRDAQRDRGLTVHYHAITSDPAQDRGAGFAEILAEDVKRLKPEQLVVVQPGDWRVLAELERAADHAGLDLTVLPDRHFYCSLDQFRDWAGGRKSLLLETFYRWMRKDRGVLLDDQGEPVGGAWNFDRANREVFPKEGPGRIKPPRRFQHDDTTREVIDLVRQRFADHPGDAEGFDLPVTPGQAGDSLRDFIDRRLPTFGDYEDAMWTDEHFLYHSRLSAPLNLKLLDPRRCVEKAVEAWEQDDAPINSVEGFVRQILGWREFIRGVYWLHMPQYAERNALRCDDRDVPEAFWTGQTDMNCVAHAMRSVLDHGYAHHIQRLMVLGQLALLLGVHPYRFHQWHMAMYLDAVDWVSLPNALGMSQYGDGGIVGSKPYCASGAYIHKMSNYCEGCRYQHNKALGDDACPFTTLYWDFLARHEKRFAGNNRMALQLRNLEKKDADERRAIRRRAARLRDQLAPKR